MKTREREFDDEVVARCLHNKPDRAKMRPQRGFYGETDAILNFAYCSFYLQRPFSNVKELFKTIGKKKSTA